MFALALALIAQTAPSAQQRMVVPGPLPRAEAEANIAARFALLDSDHDGAIDMAEAEAIARAVAAEAATHHGPRMVSDIPGTGPDTNWFAPTDTDHDGRVTRAEFAAAPLANFDRIDVDHDGVLSAEERMAGMRRG